MKIKNFDERQHLPKLHKKPEIIKSQKHLINLDPILIPKSNKNRVAFANFMQFSLNFHIV